MRLYSNPMNQNTKTKQEVRVPSFHTTRSFYVGSLSTVEGALITVQSVDKSVVEGYLRCLEHEGASPWEVTLVGMFDDRDE